MLSRLAALRRAAALAGRGRAAAAQGLHAAAPAWADADADANADAGPALDLGAPQSRKVGSPKVSALVEAVLQLNMLEVHDFTTILAERLGVPSGGMMMQQQYGAGPAPAVAAAAPAAAAAAAPAAAAPAKASFDVKLEGFDAASKIKLIKEVRAATGLGLKEAKDLVRCAGREAAAAKERGPRLCGERLPPPPPPLGSSCRGGREWRPAAVRGPAHVAGVWLTRYWRRPCASLPCTHRLRLRRLL